MATENDTALFRLSDPLVALALLSRLPVPAGSFSRGAKAGWAYPLAGAVIAGIAGFVGLVALSTGLNPHLAAMLVLAAQIMICGAMHEDGLADTADGFWGGWDRDRRLEIMKDSRIGTYGVIALGLSLAARWSAISILLEMENPLLPLIAAAVISRASMPVMMVALPHARQQGLSQSVGRPPVATAGLAVALALILGGGFLGSGMFAVFLVVVPVVLAMIFLAKRKIGGQTGDILGATQQLTEIAVLFALTA